MADPPQFGASVPFAVSVRHLDRIVCCALEGELDHQTAPILLDAVGDLAEGTVEVVVLDCTKLAFVDACGLTALLRTRASVAAVGAELTVANPPTLLCRILAATSLAEVLPVADDRLLATLATAGR
ncbi:STAS domain-containing protein [Cryptosporangium minutisporangium]|uniref:Anti-sigma factor antagonist n=1 Tax=Cryptosporangium minutisporangium TaxID=113569 RepID=A0ABP6T483_9ACTN